MARGAGVPPSWRQGRCFSGPAACTTVGRPVLPPRPAWPEGSSLGLPLLRPEWGRRMPWYGERRRSLCPWCPPRPLVGGRPCPFSALVLEELTSAPGIQETVRRRSEGPRREEGPTTPCRQVGPRPLFLALRHLTPAFGSPCLPEHLLHAGRCSGFSGRQPSTRSSEGDKDRVFSSEPVVTDGLAGKRH